MKYNTIVALTSVLLTLAGIAQIAILRIQNRQSRLQLLIEYRTRWAALSKNWGVIVFIGRNDGDYYQVVSATVLQKLKHKVQMSSLSSPSVWVRESAQLIFGILNEVTLRLLQGQLTVSEAYSIFGTDFLRHSKPLRVLLDTENYGRSFDNSYSLHISTRNEIQDWLIYHDGIRRRCLILIDLLWAESARLEDLPPYDIKSAADAKKKSGFLNRRRLYIEVLKLKGIRGIFLALRLSYFLRNAEYRSLINRIGISRRRLNILNKSWTNRLLNKP